MANHIFKGDSVAILPGCNAHALGEWRGEVTSIGRKWIHVKGEKSGKALRFAIGSPKLQSLAPQVTISAHSRDLYVIRESHGYSCLGFDVCERRIQGYAAWLASEGVELPESVQVAEPRGTIARYDQYRALSAAIFAHYRATGRRCDAELTPQLIGLEGKRVEVVDSYGERRRFQVGRSTGWIPPIHLELSSSAAHGGGPVTGSPFQSVRVVS
jgi:hypothetical protein